MTTTDPLILVWVLSRIVLWPNDFGLSHGRICPILVRFLFYITIVVVYHQLKGRLYRRLLASPSPLLGGWFYGICCRRGGAAMIDTEDDLLLLGDRGRRGGVDL